MKKTILIALATCLVPLAGAQSMNIDFNWTGVGTIPTSSYGAAGLAGNWNAPNVSPSTIVNFALFDLSGAATSAILNVPSFGGSWAPTGPWTGNDSSLMEDSAGSGSNPAQIALSGLLPGNYDVIMYGMAASGNVSCAFTINTVTQSTGGAWSGSHNLGGSYTAFNGVSVPGSTLNIDFRGNANGMQLRYSTVPEPFSVLAMLGGIGALASRRRRKK